jgi:hypothetical protein
MPTRRLRHHAVMKQTELSTIRDSLSTDWGHASRAHKMP